MRGTWHSCKYLGMMPGVYAVEFPDRVKFGRASNLRSRLRTHVKDGAIGAVAAPWERYAATGTDAIERELLAAARERGVRVGQSESFTGLPLLWARDLVQIHAGPHAMAVIPVDMDQLR